MASLQVVSQTPFDLVVNSPMNFLSIGIIVGLVGSYFTCIVAYSGMPKRLPPLTRALPLWFALLATLIAVFVSAWSHTMTLSRQSGTAVLVDRWAGIPYSTRHIPLASMERATLESARPGTRIAIVLRGGSVVWPFGKAYNSPPNQYAIIDDINSFLGNHADKMSNEDF